MESKLSTLSSTVAPLSLATGPIPASVSAALNLRGKVARVVDIFEALQVTPPTVAQWPEWLARLTALLSQYENLLRELRPVLNQFILVPGEVGSNNDYIPNVLLRTRLAPELETHLEELVSSNETGGMLKVLAQILEDSADFLKTPIRLVPTPIISENEALINAVRSRYTTISSKLQ